MTDKAIIAANYSDLKIIKTRQVCQMILEVPLEHAERLVAAFGLPRPHNEVMVAVARLHSPEEHRRLHAPPKEETPPKASARAHKPFSSLPYSQQAALRCQDLSFRDFLRSKGHGCDDDGDAAWIVRSICEVESRSDIRPGTEAEKLWLRLNTEYTFWESARAA